MRIFFLLFSFTKIQTAVEEEYFSLLYPNIFMTSQHLKKILLQTKSAPKKIIGIYTSIKEDKDYLLLLAYLNPKEMKKKLPL